MNEQTRLLPGLEAEQVLAQAEAEHGPFAARVCLFSGGNDSAVTAHATRHAYDELAWLDTTTAVPGVREYVEWFAAWLDKPLRIMTPELDTYRLLVLGGTDWKGDQWAPLGFPGPAQHGRAYNRLKERLTEELHRTLKAGHPRSARVLYITGVRRAESARRAGRLPVNRKGGRVYANPLIDWSTTRLHAYRREHHLPESDVAALLHRSGECNCGAFAVPGEREMLMSLYPDWWAQRIAPLEAEAEALGLPACRWGQRPPEAVAAGQAEALFDVGELCSTCAWRQEGLA